MGLFNRIKGTETGFDYAKRGALDNIKKMFPSTKPNHGEISAITTHINTKGLNMLEVALKNKQDMVVNFLIQKIADYHNAASGDIPPLPIGTLLKKDSVTNNRSLQEYIFQKKALYDSKVATKLAQQFIDRDRDRDRVQAPNSTPSTRVDSSRGIT